MLMFLISLLGILTSGFLFQQVVPLNFGEGKSKNIAYCILIVIMYLSILTSYKVMSDKVQIPMWVPLVNLFTFSYVYAYFVEDLFGRQKEEVDVSRLEESFEEEHEDYDEGHEEVKPSIRLTL